MALNVRSHNEFEPDRSFQNENNLDEESQLIVNKMASLPIGKEILNQLFELQKVVDAGDPGALFKDITRSMQSISKMQNIPGASESVHVVLDMLGFVRNKAKDPENLKKILKTVLQEQKGRFQKQQETEREFESQMELLLLEYCEKVNEGKKGVIFRMDPKKVPQRIIDNLKERGLDILGDGEKSAAVKMFKVFEPDLVQHEFLMQEKARHLTLTAAGPEYAQVPRPWFVQNLTIENPEALKKMEEVGVLQKLGSSIKDGKRNVSILMMDYLPGDDLATYLYKWILEKKHFDKEQIDKMSFEDLQRMVQSQLGFEKAKPGSEDTQGFQVSHENGKKLYNFIGKKGFKLHPSFEKQVRNTVKLWHKNGFYHNDLHSRNIMVEGSIEEDAQTPPKVYIIDFGNADSSSDETSDDLAALITLERYIHI